MVGQWLILEREVPGHLERERKREEERGRRRSRRKRELCSWGAMKGNQDCEDVFLYVNRQSTLNLDSITITITPGV